ncbi:MAG: hypothetical protein GY731_11825, partial [Gammaproteobacteria bacterium]|nr:hypothetical protein [Gammaproteobacteria bacterium]
MARQGISKEQVYTAAAELREEGSAPTVQAVRDRLGSGSFSTISAHLAEWKAENAAQGPADIPAMPEKVQASFNQIWATASRSAQEGVETQREALEAMRREMDKERAEMAAEIGRLEGSLEDATERAERLEKDLGAEHQSGEEKAAQITALTIENTRLEEQVKAAQAQTHATENALKSENKERERDLANHAQERQRWETALEQEKHRMQTELESERTGRERDLADHAQDRQQWEKALEQEKRRLERMQTELENERTARDEAVQQAAEFKTENARLDERVKAADTRSGELKKQFEGMQKEFAEVAKARAATKKKAVPDR